MNHFIYTFYPSPLKIVLVDEFHELRLLIYCKRQTFADSKLEYWFFLCNLCIRNLNHND
jgi:hypothetical protein